MHALANKGILRTKDSYAGQVTHPEVEDLLRETLVAIARNDLRWDVTRVAAAQPKRPIIDIFSAEISGFSKYRLAKAYVRWTRHNDASNLTADERHSWEKLIGTINKALK